MLKGEQVDPWITKYAKTFDGPSNPISAVPVGSETYTLGWVCKAHDCGDNQLYVLFSPDAKAAYGLIVKGGAQRFIGHPSDAVQAALKASVQ